MDADIQESLENTQLLSMFAALDNGADTRIGEKGSCISGGEKQRLADNSYFSELYRKENEEI